MRFRAASAVAILGFIAASSAARAADDVPVGVFQGSTYDGWAVEGDAFRDGPVSGELLTRLEIENAPHGPSRVASSEREGDGPTGTLTSPEFRIERNFITFTIAGGGYERHTCVDLLIDGQVVRSATGWRSDRMTPQTWDVSALVGRTARVKLVDLAKGDWGHINVGPIVQTDSPAVPPVTVGPLYHETLRPQFHFTARQWVMNRLNPREREDGWLNDLNGLIYFEGEYHLFAQRWNKCWVHAVSNDLVHWTELVPAFWEDELDSGVQSGTCVVDYENTSGLSPDKSKPAMVAFYSLNDNRSQCVAYSLDKGRRWTKYVKNPVLSFPERDPKVFWHAPTKRWVMMLYGNEKYHVFTSANLLDWKDEKHPIDKSFECPDFFEMPVEGRPGEKKWVLIQGNGRYSVGTFDGTRFTEETPRLPCDTGDFYATQTWHNTETGDGRRIQAAWMRFSHFPDMPFSQQVTFPCELTLRPTPDGLRLCRRPVREIEKLHASGGEQTWENRVLRAGARLPLAPSGRQFRLTAELKLDPGAKLVLEVRGDHKLVLTPDSLAVDDRSAKLRGELTTLEVLIDTASIEAFANEGEVSISRFALFNANGIALRTVVGTVTIKKLTIRPLQSAWAAQAGE